VGRHVYDRADFAIYDSALSAAEIAQIYSDGLSGIGITVPDGGIAGDYNGDGFVDAADYTVWRNNLGAPDESAIQNNGDGLNGVDSADYSLWKTHFGGPTGAGSAVGFGGVSTAVPEPATWTMFLIGSFAVAATRHRRGR
jgi:hypothetical protein